MEVHVFLLQLVLILLSARIVGELANYFKIPAVIGELCAGIIIGPSLFGFVEISQPIHLLAQIGIILLLFEVGIETDIGRLAAAGGKALTVAVSGVVFPLILGFIISYYAFNLSFLISLFVGATFTATSIGITLRVLRDLEKQNTEEAQIIIGAAFLDDIIGILLLSFLYEFASSGQINLWNVGKVFLFMALFFLFAPFAAKIVSEIVRKWDEKSKIPGLLPTVIVSFILFFSWMAHLLGAPQLLGGFAAGLALSRQFFFPFAALMKRSLVFTQKVEEQIRPIVYLFTPIFFVAIGLSLDLRKVDWSSSFVWQFGAASMVVALIGKLFSPMFLQGVQRMEKIIIGAAMIPRGEVGLIFANVGLTVGVFSQDIYATLIIVIAATTLLTPFSLRWLFEKNQRSTGEAK